MATEKKFNSCVLPGVLDVCANFDLFVTAFNSEDFPTLDRHNQMYAISALSLEQYYEWSLLVMLKQHSKVQKLPAFDLHMPDFGVPAYTPVSNTKKQKKYSL